MDDKCIMNGLLVSIKNGCDLFEHGTIESSTGNVRQAFSNALSDTLSMSDSIYQQMTQKGWYQTETAPQQKLQQLKQKFAPTC